MSLLDRVTETLAQRSGEDRAATADALEQVAGNLDEASRVWAEFRDEAPVLDNPFTFLLSFGPRRAKRLHELHLEGRTIGSRLTELTGLAFRDALGVSEEVDVVQAYSQVSPQDTPESLSAGAIGTLGARRQQVMDTIASLRG